MGRVTVDEAVYKIMMQGIEKAKADVNSLAMTYSNAMRGMSASSAKGTAGLIANNKQLTTSITQTSNTMNAMSNAAKNVGSTLEKTTGKAKKFHEQINKGESLMSKYIVRGMLMSIGWQAINNVMQFAMTTVKNYFTANMELETSMKSLEFITRKTGRSFVDVSKVINNNLDSMTDRAALTTAVMKLMSTSLSTDDIDKWIKSIKAGSAAMGGDFNEEVILQARGFKQLTANILDNIGVTIYLDQVKERAAKTYKTTIALLTEEQIHQQLLTEQLKQTEKFTGLWEEKMKTTQGATERLSTSWKRFMQEIGDTSTLKGVSNTLSEFIENLTTRFKFSKIKYEIEPEKPMNPYEKYFASNKYFSANPFKVEKSLLSMLSSFTTSIEEQKKVIEDYEKNELNLQKTKEESIKIINQQSDLYKDQAMQLEINTVEQIKLTTSTTKLTDSIAKNKAEIEATTIGTVTWKDNIATFTEGALPKYQSKLKEINDLLKEQSSDLAAAEMQTKEYQKQLDAKMKVFDPKSLKETEDYLKDIQKELADITREEERNRDDMWKRVEPKLRKQIELDNIRIQEEKAGLLEKEKSTRALLLTEITDLNVKLALQEDIENEIKNRVTEIEGKTYDLTEAQTIVQDKIDGINARVKELNTMNLFSKEKLEEDMKALKDTELIINSIKEKMNLISTMAIDTSNKLSKQKTSYNIPYKDNSPIEDYTNKDIVWEVISTPSKQKTSNSNDDFRLSSTSELLANRNNKNAQKEMDDRGIKYELGTKFVPQTGMYQLHVGESVSTKRETEVMMNGSNMNFQPGSIIVNAGNRSAESLFTEIERVARRKINRGVRI